MSIKLMTQAWDTDAKGNELIVLLSLADYANDEGYCYPSWSTLLKKCKISRDTLARVLKHLEEVRYVQRESRKRTNGSDASNGYIVLQNAEAKYENRTLPKVRKSDYQSTKIGLPPVRKSYSHTNHHLEPSIEPPIESVEVTTCDDAQEVASYLLQKIQTHQPSFKVQNLKAWARDIDLALRVDGRTKEQLIRCINWIYGTQRGNFWIANVLSGKKLREKFNTMQMQSMQKETKHKTNDVVDAIYGQGATAQELIEQMERGA